MNTGQQDLISQLRAVIEPANNLADTLADDLNIGKAEVYRKISGKTKFSIDQIEQLCEKYHLQFVVGQLGFTQSSRVNFIPFNNRQFSVVEYLKTIDAFFTDMEQAKSKTIYCATDDIPLFYLFAYPELAAFKLHFWNMRIYNKAAFRFDFKDWSHEANELLTGLNYKYLQIPSVEIWTKNQLLNTINQLKYAAYYKMIGDSGIGKTICIQLRNVIENIETYALQRSKSTDKEVLFDWYIYESIGSITYLTEVDEALTAYIRFNNFNFLKEQNGPICQEIRHWMHNLMQDSVGISGHGSIERNKYLQESYTLCDELSRMF